jgi:hypothetical protein
MPGLVGSGTPGTCKTLTFVMVIKELYFVLLFMRSRGFLSAYEHYGGTAFLGTR